MLRMITNQHRARDRRAAAGQHEQRNRQQDRNRQRDREANRIAIAGALHEKTDRQKRRQRRRRREGVGRFIETDQFAAGQLLRVLLRDRIVSGPVVGGENLIFAGLETLIVSGIS